MSADIALAKTPDFTKTSTDQLRRSLSFHETDNGTMTMAEECRRLFLIQEINTELHRRGDDGLDSEGYPIGSPREWSNDELKELRRRERACDDYGSM